MAIDRKRPVVCGFSKFFKDIRCTPKREAIYFTKTFWVIASRFSGLDTVTSR